MCCFGASIEGGHAGKEDQRQRRCRNENARCIQLEEPTVEALLMKEPSIIQDPC